MVGDFKEASEHHFYAVGLLGGMRTYTNPGVNADLDELEESVVEIQDLLQEERTERVNEMLRDNAAADREERQRRRVLRACRTRRQELN